MWNPPEPPWYERLRFSGDFRSRYEGFYQSGRTTRNRGRLRLRLRIDTDINEDTSLHLQVSSGESGDTGFDKSDLYEFLSTQARSTWIGPILSTTRRLRPR